MTAPARPVALVADDSPTMRGFHAAVLRSAGFDVQEADNGAAALELLAHVDVDLAVVDVNMPVMDGLTFLDRVPEVGRAPRAVVVVSSQADAEHVAQAMRRGADHYLVKPVDPQALLSVALDLVAPAASGRTS